jgi:hypothetical protein
MILDIALAGRVHLDPYFLNGHAGTNVKHHKPPQSEPRMAEQSGMENLKACHAPLDKQRSKAQTAAWMLAHGSHQTMTPMSRLL